MNVVGVVHVISVVTVVNEVDVVIEVGGEKVVTVVRLVFAVECSGQVGWAVYTVSM